MASIAGLRAQESSGGVSAAALRAQLVSIDAQKRELDERLRASIAEDDDALGLGMGLESEGAPDFVNGVFVGQRPATLERQLDVVRRMTVLRTRDLPLRGRAPAMDADCAAEGWGIARFFVPPLTDLALAESVAERLLADSANGAQVQLPQPDAACERTPDR